MVPGPNFYIYGGGRWREVDNDGRVEGWGRARFVYAKRGKVHMAKTRNVLAALRDLKAGKKSALKDGARLPHKSVVPLQKKEGRHPDTSEYDHSQCCNRPNNGSPRNKIVTKPAVKVTTQSKPKIDAAIQTTTSQTLTFPDYRKKTSDRNHSDSISSNDNVPTKLTTTALVNSSSNKLTKLKLKKQWSLVGTDKSSPKKQLPNFKLHKGNFAKYNLYKRKRTNSSDSLVWVVMPKTDDLVKTKHPDSEYVKSESKKTKRRRESTSSKSSQDIRPQKIEKRSTSTLDLASNITHENPKTQKPVTISSDNSFKQLSRPAKSSPDAEKAKPASQDKFKELIIGEEDVDVLRNYLIHNNTNFNLLKFDEDDEYKRQFFYTINPLVNVERCPKIAIMLRRDSQSDICLKDFASQLGLTSVSEKRVPQRYKIRKRINKTENAYYKSDTENSQKNINRGNKGGGDATRTRYSMDTETDVDEIKRLSSTRRNAARRRSLRNAKQHRQNEADSDEGSSVVHQAKARILRKSKRRSSGNLNLNFTSDSEEHFKESKKQASNRRKLNTKDSSKSSDSDWVEEISVSSTNTNKNEGTMKEVNKINETVGTTSKVSIKSRVRNNKGRFSKVYLKAAESTKEVTKTGRNKNAKRNNSEQTDSDEDNVSELSERSKSVLIRYKNDLTQQNSRPSKKDSGTGSLILIEARTKKQRHELKGSVKKNVVTYNENSDEELKSRKSQNKTPNSTTNNVESKYKTFDSQEIKRTRRNNMANNSNDRNNNMTDTNDDNSGADERKNETRTAQHKATRTRNTTKTYPNDKQPENVSNRLVFEDDSTKSLHGSDAIENHVFTKPAVAETKSIPFISRDMPQCPSSSASSVPRMEYSNLEDHAIVTWLSMGGRAQCVNGNHIWRQLQDQYHNITGQHRTWHSLRNRYLRSILPKLGQLALNPSLVARLRAAAATGKLKSLKNPSKRNSIFGAPPVPGALSRRPRAERSPSSDLEPPQKKSKQGHTRKSPSPVRKVLRPSLHSSTERAARSPRYSEITRKFAARHHESTPNSPTNERKSPRKKPLDSKNLGKNSPETNKSDKNTETKKSEVTSSRNSDTKNSYKNLSLIKSSSRNTPLSNTEGKSKGSSSVKSSATKESPSRTLRKSVIKSPALKENEESPAKGRTKTRRLFNPSSMI